MSITSVASIARFLANARKVTVLTTYQVSVSSWPPKTLPTNLREWRAAYLAARALTARPILNLRMGKNRVYKVRMPVVKRVRRSDRVGPILKPARTEPTWSRRSTRGLPHLKNDKIAQLVALIEESTISVAGISLPYILNTHTVVCDAASNGRNNYTCEFNEESGSGMNATFLVPGPEPDSQIQVVASTSWYESHGIPLVVRAEFVHAGEIAGSATHLITFGKE